MLQKRRTGTIYPYFPVLFLFGITQQWRTRTKRNSGDQQEDGWTILRRQQVSSGCQQLWTVLNGYLTGHRSAEAGKTNDDDPENDITPRTHGLIYASVFTLRQEY